MLPAISPLLSACAMLPAISSHWHAQHLDLTLAHIAISPSLPLSMLLEMRKIVDKKMTKKRWPPFWILKNAAFAYRSRRRWSSSSNREGKPLTTNVGVFFESDLVSSPLLCLPILCASSLNGAPPSRSSPGRQAPPSRSSKDSSPASATPSPFHLASRLRFVDEHRIHLVCDEIYSTTVSSRPAFVSVAEVLEEHLDICDWPLQGPGFPGFRISIVYSYNDEVVRCGQWMSSFGLVSSQTQGLLASMLLDEEFMGAFMKESTRRLGQRRAAFTAGLAEVGIGCLEGANAGLFLWMNLQSLLEEGMVEEEMKLWRTIMEEVKLNVSSGSSFHCIESGWLRVCIANMDEATVGLALQRMRRFIERSSETGLPVRRMGSRVTTLGRVRLSLSSLMAEDVCMSTMLPELLSPHSSLVRATSEARSRTRRTVDP
ncbi:hypothetical protein Taro_048432 [Colocasia esculenta]|uniref:1-aminocyclopropane-1-carboxylate synthase n=1 Tax=Colocasia esculenta TaxID=4460 RepID=A0A843X2Q5_COLES|nr:hypothetical protein [Colocasia esculenta]